MVRCILQKIQEAHQQAQYRPVAVVVLSNTHNEVLFVQSAKNASEWSWPQGGIEASEDIFPALYRELSEELGVSKSELEFLGYLGSCDLDAESARCDRRGFRLGKRYFFFHLRYIGSGEFVLNPSEISAFRWSFPSEAEWVLSTTREAKRKMLLRILSLVL